jgi:hypothetical protein
MTATNHCLAGALLGAVLPLPLAIPAAFASHFAMDALPHFGVPRSQRSRSGLYKFVVSVDTLSALSIGISAIVFRKWNMEIGGWAAYSPDFLWVLAYFHRRHNLNIRPTNAFMKLHARIQNEHEWGIVTEVIIFALLFPPFLARLLA